MAQNPDSASLWNSVLIDEFANESDRAAVILTAAIFEEVLEALLNARLCPATDDPDELFAGTTSPAATLHAKIVLAYRLGLVSAQFRRDLHVIRRIRNDFAHNVHGCSFDATPVRARVSELGRSSGVIERCKALRDLMPSGTRCDFLFVASWMLRALNQKVAGLKRLSEAPLEFGYSYSISQDEIDGLRRNPETKLGGGLPR
jgi:hypothetical protein